MTDNRSVKVEAMARAMCIAMGCNPDVPAVYGPPMHINGLRDWRVADQQETVPAWHAFAGMADAALSGLNAMMLDPGPDTVEIEPIARVCHEANRAWCIEHGDTSQPAWDDAPDWQRQSTFEDIAFVLSYPDAGDSALHDKWLRAKERDGWTFGPVKDETAKTHPCMVPFGMLAPEHQAKDRLFSAIVMALRG